MGEFGTKRARLWQLASWFVVAGVSLLCASPFAHAQFATQPSPQAASLSASATPAPSLPEPIYWKQDLFLIPYQWGSPAEPTAAQAVWLYLSKDRGVSWQKISEANPQVRAFNYRANGDGEYWFTIRTLDTQGRTWPSGAYQPELRVIVDTTIPRIEALQAQILPNGPIAISWRCSDLHLDTNSLSIEAQVDSASTWQPVSLAAATAIVNPVTTTALGLTHSGQIQWTPPNGVRPLAIRATVMDLAKNTATYRTELNLVASGAVPALPVSAATVTASPAAASRVFAGPTLAPTTAMPSNGWTSASTMPAGPTLPSNQPWPATATDRVPFRLSSVGAKTEDDGVTSYGSPPVVTSPPITPTPATTPPPAPTEDRSATNMNAPDNRVEAQYAATSPIAEGGVEQAPANGPRFAARDAKGHNSFTRLPSPTTAAPSPVTTNPSAAAAPIGPVGEVTVAPSQVKRVGSRTFALEYDLDDAGRWGVAKVELWGTRDGGKTWHSFARDDDNRSPLVVTVDQEGLYGFRIAVDIAGSAAASPPAPGDVPELWVSVDLRRPVVELTAIERGDGNLADHLIFRWRVADDNLEPRPISLFYSSRPTGPWSAIATNLEDTGEYAWRVDRYVPARFFVRVEARDTAGNLAAFQTREPIEFEPVGGGHLRSAEPIGPTAAESHGALR